MTRLSKYPEMVNGKLHNPERQHRREMERVYEGVLNLKSGRQWKKYKKMVNKSKKVLLEQLDMSAAEFDEKIAASDLKNIEL
jgi:hypothetical protein